MVAGGGRGGLEVTSRDNEIGNQRRKIRGKSRLWRTLKVKIKTACWTQICGSSQWRDVKSWHLMIRVAREIDDLFLKRFQQLSAEQK